MKATENVTLKIGIMAAMQEEISGVISMLSDRSEIVIGQRVYYCGTVGGIDTVVVFSRWGKVAAATTATTLIQTFNVTEIIFTGVAGAIDRRLKIGDIVLGTRLVQHDMDARPLIPKHEIPLLNKTFFEIPAARRNIVRKAIEKTIEENHLSREALSKSGIVKPALFSGDIASGDRFISDNRQKEELRGELPSILCVEMEGAAVAQVCYEHNVALTVIRIISDAADDSAHLDFPEFIKEVASIYSTRIITNIYSERRNEI